VHIISQVGDRRAICGASVLPRVLLEHVPAHVAGHAIKLCPACVHGQAES